MAHSELLADKGGPYCTLAAREAFNGLTSNEKFYAYHMLRAGFNGTRILLRQTSPESEEIFDLILGLHERVSGNWGSLIDLSNITEEDLNLFLEYAAMFLANIGNYRSQGDRKFIPRLSSASFERICSLSARTRDLYDAVGTSIYLKVPNMFGYPSNDYQSGYYPGSPDITREEIESVQKASQENGIDLFNTRLRKIPDDSSDQPSFEILVASSEKLPPKSLSDSSIQLRYGDHQDSLRKIILEIEAARSFVSNCTQGPMLEQLIESLKSGNTEAFKKHQELWVKDKGPVVEISHGFIESYQDPQGVRCSWQGFVGVTRKSQAQMYQEMVDRAPEFMYALPWNHGSTTTLSPYENPTFVKPDFTNLDVLGFCCSEMWSGINLPNFEDICQVHGFKNLTLGNVNNNNILDKFVPFIKDSELTFFTQHRARAFEVMVACHELLGHGSGRLFLELEPGRYNFDINARPTNLLTNVPIESWYRHGETWQSIFGRDAGSYEECRADGVALLLVTHRTVLEIFKYTDDTDVKADDVTYGGWLQFIQGALKGLAQWNADTKKWGQAHKRGQYAILRMLLENTKDLLRLENTGEDLIIHLDRDRILSRGVPALSDFLKTLQVFKSTADVEGGRKFYDHYSNMTEEFVRHREVSMKIKPNRTQWIQPNLLLNDKGEIELREYPPTKEALIQSWVERDV